MNSKNGIVSLLLFLAIWLVYTDAIILPLRSGIKRRTRTKAVKKPSTTVPPNAITKMMQNGVKPNNSKVRSLTSIIDPQGKIKLKSFSGHSPTLQCLCIHFSVLSALVFKTLNRDASFRQPWKCNNHVSPAALVNYV